jgi:aspartyl/asparaginyl beta-hydroxylase (cupin superfamily)
MSYLNLFSNTEWTIFGISSIPIIHKILYLINNQLATNMAYTIEKIIDNKFNILRGLSLIYLIMIIIFIYRLWQVNININIKVIITLCVIVYLYIELITILNSWNTILELISPNPPMNIDKKYFPGSIYFEHEILFPKIKQEVLHILENYNVKCLNDQGSIIGLANSITPVKNCWRWQILKLNGKNNNILNDYPILQNLISDPNIFTASISILEPHVSIPEHRGYFKGFLRYQLCIETPDDDPNKPYIICGGEKYVWKTGEGILFDDVFLHQVINNSNSRRIVLYFDILRNNISDELITINKIMAKLISNNFVVKQVLKKQHIQKSNKNIK